MNPPPPRPLFRGRKWINWISHSLLISPPLPLIKDNLDSNESPSVFSSFMSAYWYFYRRKPLWRHDWRRGVQFCGKWSKNAQNVNYKPGTVSRPLVKESFRNYVTTAIQLQARSKQWGVGHMKKKANKRICCFFPNCYISAYIGHRADWF